MANILGQPPARSLLALMQEVRNSVSTEPLTADEQRALLHLVADILAACGRTVASPLPGRDLQEVRGHPVVKRALEVAAAGGHHLLLVGPPGTGKALLARTLSSILPATAVPFPFRAPNAAISVAAFVGEPTAPGELTLAHGGILLLENLHVYDIPLLAALRHAVEAHVVSVSHGEEPLSFPANFLLVATSLPCPCGWYNDPVRECTCSADAIVQHQRPIKEIMDACFDLHMEVFRGRPEDLLGRHPEESSARVRSRVEQARARQQHRYVDAAHLWVNADLNTLDEVQQHCQMDAPAEKLIKAAFHQLHLTPGQLMRIQRLARTIADLAESERIAANHIAEAIQYRPRF